MVLGSDMDGEGIVNFVERRKFTFTHHGKSSLTGTILD